MRVKKYCGSFHLMTGCLLNRHVSPAISDICVCTGWIERKLLTQGKYTAHKYMIKRINCSQPFFVVFFVCVTLDCCLSGKIFVTYSSGEPG